MRTKEEIIEEIIEILRCLPKCPIKGWQDLGEDATPRDIWAAQAEWIFNKMYY